MSGAIPPVPNKLSWRGAQLKHRDTFTFTVTGIAKCRNWHNAYNVEET